MSPNPEGLDNRRFISFILVSFIVMIAYTKWIGHRYAINKIADNIIVTDEANQEKTIEKKLLEKPKNLKKIAPSSIAVDKYESEIRDDYLAIKYRNFQEMLSSVKVLKYSSSEKPVDLIPQTEDPRRNFATLRGPFGDDLDVVYLHKNQDKTVILEGNKSSWTLQKSFSLTANPYLVDFSWKIEGPSSEM